MVIDLNAERQKRGVEPKQPPSKRGVVVELRAARLQRANARIIAFDKEGAEADIKAARYILCATKLPGASLAEIAEMTRYSSKQKPRESHVRTSSKPRSRTRR